MKSKRIDSRAILALLIVMIAAGRAPAVQVGNEIFLQGQYVEVGIHASGSFGTTNLAPAGFHPRLSPTGTTGQLGFVADMDKDGWTIGTPPQSGDYFVPGTPEEGWSVEWTTGGSERAFHNYGLVGLHGIPTTSLTETSSGSEQSALWEGTATNGAEQLRVLTNVHFDQDNLFFIMGVTLTNTGSVTLDSVEYMRNVDPDQEQPITFDFTTSNYVALQPGIGGNADKALVVAEGLIHGITLGLATIDSRAVVSTEGFSNRDPDAILDSPTNHCTETSRCVGDQAIVLAYRFGSLAPGQSVSFDYAYILNEGDLDVALGQLAAVTVLQPVGTVSGTAVLFQSTTDDVPNTTQIEFFANGVSLGVDTTPDAGGVFEISFDSTVYANGPLNLRAVATFAGGGTAEDTVTVTVDNSGPPIAFANPVPGQIFSGTGIPVLITVLDPGHPPVQINFFRETSSTGSIAIGSDSSEPFSTTFGVDDLPGGETVVIKAVARDSLNRTTTIQVSGTTASLCGNGVEDAGEACDDGNSVGGDCCSAACQYETAGGSCADDGDACTQDVCGGGPDQGTCVHPPLDPLPVECQEPCGNGTIDVDEQCDDGNQLNGDCCDANCMYETGACEDGLFCTEGDACLEGDCIPGPARTCDDGNSCTADSCDEGDRECDNVTDAGLDGLPCDDGNVCSGDGICAAGMCLGAPLNVENAVCDNCDDGLDNDVDSRTDGEDAGCSLLADASRFAVVAADTSTRTAARLGKRFTSQGVDGADASLPYPLGPSLAGVCGGSMSIRPGTEIGLLASTGRVRIQRSSFTDSITDLGIEAASNGGDMIFRDEGPYVGPMVCSDDRVTPCTSNADCGGNLCGTRLRLSESPNPFVSSDGSSETYGRCTATIAGLGPIAAAIAGYAPAAAERVSLANACPACTDTQELGASARDGEIVVTLGGGLQVLDVNQVHLGGQARLRLRGQDDTVLLVRIHGHLRLGSRAAVVVDDNGLGLGTLSADRVLWAVGDARARVSLGAFSHFTGTLLSIGPRGIRVGSGAAVDGALIGRRVRLGNLSSVLHAPFLGRVP